MTEKRISMKDIMLHASLQEKIETAQIQNCSWMNCMTDGNHKPDFASGHTDKNLNFNLLFRIILHPY